MQKAIITTGALVVGFALASATDLAQNMQGPAAPDFGVSSNPQTGGTPNTGPNSASPQPQHNNVPGNHSGQAHARSKHATGSDGR